MRDVHIASFIGIGGAMALGEMSRRMFSAGEYAIAAWLSVATALILMVVMIFYFDHTADGGDY